MLLSLAGLGRTGAGAKEMGGRALDSALSPSAPSLSFLICLRAVEHVLYVRAMPGTVGARKKLGHNPTIKETYNLIQGPLPFWVWGEFHGHRICL